MSEFSKLFSQEGSEALRQALNSDPRWQKEAASWTTALGLVWEGGSGNQGLFVELQNGSCEQLHPASPGELAQAEFVLQGSDSVWRGILSGQLDPVGAVFMGKLKVTRGNVMALASRTGAARVLLEKARSIVEGLA